MKTWSYVVALLGFLVLEAGCASSGNEIIVTSPDKALSCVITTDSASHLSYTINMDESRVVLSSPLGIIVDGDDLGDNASWSGNVQKQTVNETYATRGAHSRAVNHYNEVTIPVKGGKEGESWFLDVRAFPDAVAYRYRVPGEGRRKIDGETSAWQLMRGTTLWYQSNRKKDYEMPYACMNPDTVSLPVSLLTTSTFKLPDGAGYAMIGEAALSRYSDMALLTRGGSLFESLFHNSPEGWTHEGGIVSPWRVVVLAKSLNGLVNTDVFRNLCPSPSPDLANASWIVPGKSTWAWMVTGRPAFKEQKKWVDWTSQLGFEYYLIDDGWQKWSDGDKGQWEMMKEIVDYARTKQVGIWAWVRTKEMKAQKQRGAYFAKVKAAGLAGLKIDFMGAGNPDWIQWYEDVLEETAAIRLMVNFHGANKPSGGVRTWPHEMSREAIRGREMGKQRALHDTSLPFTRFIVGDADYTPTDFRPEKLKGSTWAHELAMPVVFTSALMVLAGDPVTYLESEACDFMGTLPVTWDETLVLPGSEIGETAAFARRHGNDWYVGVINGKARELEIDMGFLGEGRYLIEEFRDLPGRTDAWQHDSYETDRNARLTVRLNNDGGFVARIRPLNK